MTVKIKEPQSKELTYSPSDFAFTKWYENANGSKDVFIEVSPDLYEQEAGIFYAGPIIFEICRGTECRDALTLIYNSNLYIIEPNPIFKD